MLSQLRNEGPITAKEAMEGVTPSSNWIIPGSILVGDSPLPGSSLELLLDYGVSFFVDLRPTQRQPYLQQSTIEVPPDTDYRAFDLAGVINAPSTQKLAEAADFLAGVIEVALLDERVVYIHCGDGGQLTAVAACVIVAYVYNLTALKASTVVSQQYACRSVLAVEGSLFTTQLKTVCRELSTALNSAMVSTAPMKPPPPPQAPSPALPQRVSTPSNFGTEPPPMQSPYEQPPGAYSSPNRMKPSTLSPDHLVEREGHPPPFVNTTPASFASTSSSSLPTPAFAAPQSTPTQATPASSHGRFAHTRGHGGGQSQLNLFGSDAEITTTPTRRGGRAMVMQQQEMPPPAQRPPSAMSSPATSLTAQSAAAITAIMSSSGYNTPAGANTPVRPTCETPVVGHTVAASMPPPLEPKKTPQLVRGPTPTSNWVVQGSVCCGAKPIPGQHRYFAALAAERFNCFVVLTEHDVSAEYLSPYETVSQQDPGSTAVRCVSIADGAMVKGTAAQDMMRVVDEVAHHVEHGEWKVYVHCDKGHGRTGLFVTALLWRLYGMTPMRAMNYCDALHSCRSITDDQSSPQTQDQRTGIVSLLLNATAR